MLRSMGVRRIFARTTLDAHKLVRRGGVDVGAQFIAPAWGAMPLPGRNELRPYIRHHASRKNRTHTHVAFSKQVVRVNLRIINERGTCTEYRSLFLTIVSK